MDLAEMVYVATRAWPKDEVYGLTAQVRRAAVSVPSNIAEGQGRASDNELARFTAIAHGSVCELETQLMLARRLSYLDESTLKRVLAQTAEVGRLLHGLLRSLRA